MGLYAYVAVGSAGLGVVDVSDPSNPHQVGYWDELPAFSGVGDVFVTGSEKQLPSKTPTPAQSLVPTKTPRAQKPEQGELDIDWSRTFGGEGNDEGWSVQQTTDGGFIIAGVTDSHGSGDKAALLIQTDAQGNRLWEKTFGEANDREDWVHSLTQTRDGGYLLVGYTEEDIGGDVWLIKTDAEGNRVWDRKLGTSRFEEYGQWVQQTSDGGYIIAGSAMMSGRENVDAPFNYDALLMKTDELGNEEWRRTFGDANWDDGNSVLQTSDGGYILLRRSGSSFIWPPGISRKNGVHRSGIGL